MKMHGPIRRAAFLAILGAYLAAAGSFPSAVDAAAVATSPKAPVIAYSKLTGDEIKTGCEDAVKESEAILAEMVKVPAGSRTFDNTMMPLNSIEDLMGKAFGRYAFMSYVSSDEALRDAARAQEEAMNKWAVDLGFREDVYQAVRDYANTSEAKALTGERKRLLDFVLRDYRRNGFELSKKKREKIQEMRKRLVELGLEFEKNVAEWDAGIEVPPDRTAGLPETYLAGLKKKENGNYWVSLDYPDLYPFLENSKDSDLRKELTHKAWNQAYPDNIKLLEEAIAVRDEIAKTLGYKSWAHYVTEVRMAKSPEQVNAFLDDLRTKVEPKFEEEKKLVLAKYGSQEKDGSIDYWDWTHYIAELKKTEYNVDAMKAAEYFPMERVIDGLFGITQEMFGLRFVEVENPDVWHPDVQLFEIYDSATNEFIAHFYVDLYPRDDKFSHAAAFPLRSGGIGADGKRQTPVSSIVANFTKPTADTPSLLTHDEVETFFHEFGHILHQTLTKAELARFAGSATEQDFVEAPSQNLEHWIWEPVVLDRFAAHYQTGEKMPRELLNGMIEAKTVGKGKDTLRQIFYAKLDMAYHEPGGKKNTTKIMNELHPVCGFPNMKDGHFQSGFGHLFGYDAAYYGYLWSKVYGDDMFSAFEEAGVLAPEVGMRYRREIYEKGGTLDGKDLARNFLGRETNNQAFLRDLGLAPAAAGAAGAGAGAGK
jgi:thimet oligopeptidase